MRVRTCDSVANGPTHGHCPYERRSLIDELAGRGVRLTGQRRTIVEIIQSSDRHLDAAALLELARKREPGINRATVYRTLDLLKRLRLIDQLDLMHLQGEKHFYEVKTRRDHIHLACFVCGGIEEFTSTLLDQLKAEVSKSVDFSIRVAQLEVGGICRRCTAAGKTSATREYMEAAH